MASEWRVAPLADVVDDILDRRGVTPLKLGSEFVHAGHRVISAKLIKSGRVDLAADEPRFIDHATYLRWMRTPLQADDVIVTSEAPLGEVAYLAAPSDWALGQRLFAIRTDKRRLHGRFLYYALQSEGIRHELQSRATGTTAQGIRQSELRLVQVPVPPLGEQLAIARILGALDDKIELNRGISQTLEATAQALFQSWFVDFDPVRAKAESRGVELPAHLADLFPDAFEGSELGEIPAGWRATRLEECVDVVRGVSYKGSGLSPEGLPMHNLNSIYEGGGYKRNGLKYYTGDHRLDHVAHPGDLIVANTEQGHYRRLIGYAAVVPALFESVSLFSHHLYRVRPKAPSELTPEYLYHMLNSDAMHHVVSGYANGTTVNMLPIDGLQSPEVVVPPPRVVTTFSAVAGTMRGRKEETESEERTLSSIRDALLPRLISGALRVPAAERVTQDAIEQVAAGPP